MMAVKVTVRKHHPVYKNSCTLTSATSGCGKLSLKNKGNSCAARSRSSAEEGSQKLLEHVVEQAGDDA